MKNLIKQIFSNAPVIETITPLEEGGRCTHTWELIARTYAPPLRHNTQVVEDIRMLEKIMFGVTSMIWKCTNCGEMRKEEMMGTDENQLLDVLERVDRNGGQPQYIKENDKVYVIMEYVPPALLSNNG